VFHAKATSANAINRADDAARDSQGEKFRIEGIGADMDALEAKLGEIWEGVENAREALPSGNTLRSSVAALKNGLETAAYSGTLVYANHIGDAPPSGNTAVADLNGTYGNMSELLEAVAENDYFIEADFVNMDSTANSMALGEPGADGHYWDLTVDVGFGVDLNCVSCAAYNPANNNVVSAYTYAASAKEAATGDVFASKGVRTVVNYFDSYLEDELAGVAEQIEKMQNMDPSVYVDPGTIANLLETGFELEGARSVLAEI
jgi:hypothetical protein